MRTYGLPVESDTWSQRVPGLGKLPLQNLWASLRANRPTPSSCSRTVTTRAAVPRNDARRARQLVELARSYAGRRPRQRRVRGAHTVVFLSTDGGAYGGLGAARFAARSPFRVVAVINLDAIAAAAPPRLVITGDQPRSPAATLVETASQRLLEQTGQRVRRAGFFDQLVDLAFLFTLYEQRQPVRMVVRRSPSRPPAIARLRLRGRRRTWTRRGSPPSGAPAGIGRVARRGLDLAQGAHFIWVGDRWSAAGRSSSS
jgi:hypothetical protein